jgi:hypothetical protein
MKISIKQKIIALSIPLVAVRDDANLSVGFKKLGPH